MKIVNVIKDSFTECAPFSWGLSLFSFGCNLHCKMCEGYNYETVTNKNNISGSAIEMIDKYTTPMHDCIVFIGGEPTIWEDKLEEALAHAHNKGLKTKIFSNGMLPNTIGRICEKKLCDAWSVDFKGLNNIKEQFGIEDASYLKNMEESLSIIMSYKLPLEIRTTFFNGNESDRDAIINKCSCTLEDYKKYNKDIYSRYIIQEDIRPYLPPKDILLDL